MDSISQFALGAAVGVAVMGRHTAPWKAALWGGVCGTLPDLDALIDHGDPVSNMTLHRAQTHALFWQTLAAPLLAALAGVFGRGSCSWRDGFGRRLLAVWLILVTHALLDAMTVYGTQLALPFSNHPFGVGSIFIIDPLYTIPLLVGLAVAVRARRPGHLTWNLAGLALSTAYLAWSAAAQWQVTAAVRAQLAGAAGAPVERVLVTPAPFNTLLWRVVVMREHGYDEGFVSLLDRGRPVRFDTFPRDAALHGQLRTLEPVARIAWFTKGFFSVNERDGVVRITDLRMGQEPFYVFSFAVARRASEPAPITPPQSAGGRGGLDPWAYLGWIARRSLGADLPPPH
ncbi:metal-dependent hydrolase [Quisquiliibacterium transsilvanicum]|uniref:Inner membrane protein n=1 Tax=Quisquiliibacterium transsilvanicum TaxID=1549638 RepID=A0A7W8HF48_9BURK|nr:metal-dependent hydrolase [Quisquiliibacterium transsilvanicum]MBB5270682.1 inner membrane protein [Quisquiliibacterium transsilvanicum]